MNEDAMLDVAFESRYEDDFEPTHDHMERDWDEEYIPEPDYDDSMDGDHDSAMASAGWGTDEDYGYFGGDEY